MPAKILILGAGPAGLGAAWRCHERGDVEWELLEANPYPGGLSASFVDPRGFTWDLGGHVLFSHYEYFDRVMERVLPADEWLTHARSAWIWVRGVFVPYPFQNNLRYLPQADLTACLCGLSDLYRRNVGAAENFQEWVLATFGLGIARIFMLPFNEKVWAWPPERMSVSWVGERVAPVDFEKVLWSVINEQDERGFGPNHTFRYPLHGGTGAIWKACARQLPADRLHFGEHVTGVDLGAQRVTTAAGRSFAYSELVSTLPLTELAELSGRGAVPELQASSSHIVGVGLRGEPPRHLASKTWIYFPESDCPFYRVTVLSRYSPFNVPREGPHWSLLCETAESSWRPVDAARLVDATLEGLRNTRLLSASDEVVSTWQQRCAYGYPIPTLERDGALKRILPELEGRSVYSRGRFGAWKYEVGNQDHSFMQGVEVVDRLQAGRPERTLLEPHKVNK